MQAETERGSAGTDEPRQDAREGSFEVDRGISLDPGGDKMAFPDAGPVRPAKGNEN